MADDHRPQFNRRVALKGLAGAGTVGLTGLAGCFSGGGGGDDDRSQLAFALSGNQGSAHYEGAQLLADTVEEKSDGELTLDVICCQQAGGPPEITQSVQSGSLDIGLSAVNNLAGLTPAWLVSQLPYLWKSHQDMYEFWNNADVVEDINQRAYQDLDNIEVLSYWGSNGGSMRHLHFTSNPDAQTPDDLDGQKIRVTESPIEQSTIDQWNLSPSPIAWSETVSAMQQGTVSGIHIHYFWLYNSDMFEQIKYTVETATQDSPAVVHMNKDTLDNLSEDKKNILNESISEVTPQQIDMDIQQGEEAKNTIQEENPDIEIYTPTDEELSEWQSAASSVYDEWLGEDGVAEDTVKAILEYQDYQPPGVDI